LVQNFWRQNFKPKSHLQLHSFWHQNMVQKMHAKNVDEIDNTCQFHQHFTQAFFVCKSFRQLFSSYVLLCDFWCQKVCMKNALKNVDGIPVKEGDTITEEEAERVLQHEVFQLILI